MDNLNEPLVDGRAGGRMAQQAAEQPQFSFQVLTDTHVTEDAEHVYNRNFGEALRQIRELAGTTSGIMHAGDVTDHGLPGEYAEFRRIWSEHGTGLPEITMTTGNHDVRQGDWEDEIKRFLEVTGLSETYDAAALDYDDLRRLWEEHRSVLPELEMASEEGNAGLDPIGRFLSETGTSAPYHDLWIGGYHFIFLGTERSLVLYCSLSEEQLRWLDEKLKEGAPDRPVFVFLHQPLKNTVAGSSEAQGWHGVVEDDELRAVLARHPEVILFTGHTHWELESRDAFFDGGGELPAMFGGASVAYLWNDADEHKDGSQGFFVDVYKDRVVVKGRDFGKAEWIDGARYELRYPR
ncbi:metallophosphoesterase [Paenibacillus sp. LHD-117]|uniref:metallophosphoesterase family protein n=1 Tax=Paenibacillus sp. LHD-117 TaxID=3071412 RepID=UPI0027E1D292|nr:metallophosphoesterase [Paenibacillus sp. LHD-117]MDQ6422745.1 metallophosphoesterase [Paenibacillus sp. LHD-117]